MEMSQNPVYEVIVDKAHPDGKLRCYCVIKDYTHCHHSTVVVMSPNPVATINKTPPESLLSNAVPADEGLYEVASLDEQPSNDPAQKIDTCVPDESPYEVAS